ncbi:MAG: twin-arginine translocase subunit TatC [Calditrichaeota bacterium]|nr:MAG: twin-arginine translocase subunit TatC [Calditrichota bacterium]
MPESDDKEMPFLDHLEELRWRLIKAIIAVIICAVGMYFFSELLLKLLIKPYNDAMHYLNKENTQKLIFLTPTGGFMIRIKLSVFAGAIAALPVVFYQIWQFVVPGLLEKEKKYVPAVILSATFCFLLGAAFCYLVVLRYGLRFLLGFETADMVATISVNEYLQFITMLIFVFGLVFELPILAFFLTKIGLVTPAFLRHYRRHGIVVMVILSAVITPPDVFTQLLLAGPLILLYEVSILVSRMALKKEPA